MDQGIYVLGNICMHVCVCVYPRVRVCVYDFVNASMYASIFSTSSTAPGGGRSLRIGNL